MTKPKLYVVDTNYDWGRYSIWKNQETGEWPQSLDVFGPMHMHNRVLGELEKEIQEFRKGSIFPCIELRPSRRTAHLDRGHGVVHMGDFDYDALKRLINLQPEEEFRKGLWGDSIPEDLEYINLIVRFYSNLEEYLKYIRPLSEDFDLEEHDVVHTIP